MNVDGTLIAPGGRPRPAARRPRPPAEDPGWEGRPAPAQGTVLGGRYLLLERLGAGGFGVVWRAHDTMLDRVVAVKSIPLPAGGDPERAARAAREARVTARLDHPAIVTLYEAHVEGADFHIVSELVEGETLGALIARDGLADEEVLAIGLALADALAHAHGRGIVHRDLKPHNVLVPRTPAAGGAPAKLTDFGGALLAGEEGLTRTGDVLGTLAYMAPEQLDGEQVDARADLYALALVLYEALTGVNPVRGPTAAATARRIGCELGPLEGHRRDLPRPLTRALDRALLPDPHERGTLAELRDELAVALEEGPGRSPRTRRARSPRTALPRRPPAGPEGPAPFPLPAPLGAVPPTLEGVPPERSAEPEDPAPGGWLTLPRLGWLAATLALSLWLLTAARPGLALLALCAAAPLVAAVHRPGPRWLAPALAPALGLVGFAGAFPALAGQATRWRARALLGALGYWWLRLAELPLDGGARGRHLWLGVPAVLPASPAWEGSASTAAHAVWSLLGLALLLGAALWALAAVVLPWLVRGHHAALDALAAILWATALAAAAPLLDRGAPLLADGTSGLHPGRVSPTLLLLGAVGGAAVAVLARALRGPV